MKTKPDSSGTTQKSKVDWDGLHSRINATQELLANKAVLSKEEKRSILKERARVLALESRDETVKQEFTEIIEFRLASETYGIETAFVRESFQLKDFTPLPGTPPLVLGIVNVRGQILSVLNIKNLFDLPGNGLGELNKLIIICNDRMEFGILADEIIGVRNIILSKLQRSPTTLEGLKEEYLKGITNDRLIVLDAEKLLSDKNITVNEEVSI
ncbi:MAG: chemotaxis protein CheW [Proteobacteria bacterium]|nr:chemotaxis protein CheW [Pseudomonadota bacterium]